MIFDPSFPALKGKDIIILFDYLEKFDAQEIEDQTKLLNQLKTEINSRGFKVHFASVKESISEALADFDPENSVVFNWCEQLGNNDKTFHLIPDEIEKLGFIYTGCDSKCIEITTDKILTKNILTKNGVSTPVSKVYKRTGKHLNGWSKFPSIVKPQSEHSSMGITKDSIVHNTDELTARVNFVLKNYRGGALVEEFIDGEEYLVAVAGYDEPEALPLVKLDFNGIKEPENRIYSYNAKWEPEAYEYTAIKVAVDENFEPSLVAKIKDEAVKAFQATGCQGYARLDIRVKGEDVYVVDVNSNPDMSGDISEFVIAANKLGFNYGDAVLKLCELALENNAREPELAIEDTSTFAIPAVA